jgi:hypothetical protein
MLSKIREKIESKGTYPKVLTIIELRSLIGDGSPEQWNEEFKKLVKEGKIIIRRGINHNLIELNEDN